MCGRGAKHGAFILLVHSIIIINQSITTGVQLIFTTKTAELGVRVCPNLCSYLLEHALATSLALKWMCKFQFAVSYDGGATSIDYLHRNVIIAIVGAFFRGRALQTHVAHDFHCLASSRR